MTTIDEYLNRKLTDKEKETRPIKSLEDAKKAYPEIKTWATNDKEILAAIKGVDDE